MAYDAFGDFCGMEFLSGFALRRLLLSLNTLRKIIPRYDGLHKGMRPKSVSTDVFGINTP